MILTDDNFASIVAAVREGRGIFDNIRKTLVYLLAGNAGELARDARRGAVGLPLPLLPLQLLWINLVTDGLPALALVMDPTDDDVLKRPPRIPREPMLGRAQWQVILLIGALEGRRCSASSPGAPGRDTAGRAQPRVLDARLRRAVPRLRGPQHHAHLLEVGAFTNLRLLGVVLASALVQVAIHEWSWSRSFFGIGGLSPAEWALAVAVGLAPVTVIEILKLSRRAS